MYATIGNIGGYAINLSLIDEGSEGETAIALTGDLECISGELIK